MAVTFGSVTTATPSFSWNGSSYDSAAVSHTLASGSTQIVVAVHGPVGGTINSVTWGGVALTLRADQNDGNNGRVRYYDLDAPSSGTANIVLNTNIDMSSGAGLTIFGISGVDTGTPRRTAATSSAFSATASVAATTVAGDVVVGFATTVNSATVDGALTAINSNLLAGSEYGSAAYRTASGTSTTVQWTQTSDYWGVVAIPYVPGAADTTPPALSAPTGVATSGTTATVGFTTDEANGTGYTVVTTSATQPTKPQIKAGQSHTGASGAASGSLSISSTGAKTIDVTGLIPGTTYYAHSVQADAASNDSNIVTSAAFTTSAPNVTDAGDESYFDGETGITITGTTFGASKGVGAVIISPTNNVNDANAITQTDTAWGDTSITFTAVRGTLAFGATAYLFVKHNTGAANASGHPVTFITRGFQRRMTLGIG